MKTFELNGITYRTNGDASVIEGLDGKTWNRTYSLAVMAEAKKVLAASKLNSSQRGIDDILTAIRERTEEMKAKDVASQDQRIAELRGMLELMLLLAEANIDTPAVVYGFVIAETEQLLGQ